MRARAARSRAARRGPGSCVERRTVAAPASSASWPVEQLGALGVERGERLVEHEQLRLVQERAAEGEPLRSCRASTSATRSARTSQSPKRSSSIPIRSRRSRHAVEAAVEVEVLERGQVAVEQRLVAEDSRARRGRRRPRARRPSARRGRRRAAAASSCRSRSARDDEEAAALERRGRAAAAPASARSASRARGRGSRRAAPSASTHAQRAPRGPPGSLRKRYRGSLHALCSRHRHGSVTISPQRAPRGAPSARERRRASTKPKKTMLMTPLTVKKAASSRRRSPGRTSECS